MTFFQNAQRLEHLGQDPRHGGLARSGIAHEDAVVGKFGVLHARLLPLLRDLAELRHLPHLGFHRLHPDQRIQFPEGLLQRDLLWVFGASLLIQIRHGERHEFFLREILFLCQPCSLTFHGGLEEIAHETSVAEPGIRVAGHLLHVLDQSFLQIGGKQELILFRPHPEHLCKLLGRIVGEVDVAVETGTHAAVGVQEMPHLLGVPGNDHHQTVPVILHAFEKRGNGLRAVIGFPAACQRVGFVDEKHAVQSRIDELVGFDGGLSHVTAHQSGTVGFHQVPAPQDPQLPVDVPQNPRHGGFPRPGIARKDAVIGERGSLEALFFPRLNDFRIVHKFMDLRLDIGKPHHIVQLLERLFQRPLFLRRTHPFRRRAGDGGSFPFLRSFASCL